MRKLITAILIGVFILPLYSGAAESPKKTKITISAVGDCTLGIDDCQKYLANFNKEYSKQKDDAYFFKNVASIFKKDDLTIANFEGTLTIRTTRADKKFAFKGKPSYVKILTAGGIDAVNFANNHNRDYGSASYLDTTNAFKKEGIPYFNGTKIAMQEIKGIKIGLVGINLLSNGEAKKQLKEAIGKCKKQKADLIIVNFHWGIEREYYPNSYQKSFARLAIDSGADLVLGHHPHVLQGIEEYKNKYIVYSLGNFCFGGNTNPSDKDTMIFQQSFTFEKGELVNNEIKVIPCSVSSVSTRNNYQPTPLKGKEKIRVLEKINRLSKGFGLKFNDSGKRI